MDRERETRLQRLAEAGDEDAAAMLLRLATRRGETARIALLLAGGPPSMRRWARLCQALDALDAAGALDGATLDALDARLARWSPALRDVAPAWRARLLTTGEHPLLRLGRTLYIHHRQLTAREVDRLVSCQALSAYDSVHMHDCGLHEHVDRLLEAPWLSRLRLLNLRSNVISLEQHARLLARAPNVTAGWYPTPPPHPRPPQHPRDRLRLAIACDLRRASSVTERDDVFWLDSLHAFDLHERAAALMVLGGPDPEQQSELLHDLARGDALQASTREHVMLTARHLLAAPCEGMSHPDRQVVRAAAVRVLERLDALAIERAAHLVQAFNANPEAVPYDPLITALRDAPAATPGLAAALESALKSNPAQALRGLLRVDPARGKRALFDLLTPGGLSRRDAADVLALIERAQLTPEEVRAHLVPAFKRCLVLNPERYARGFVHPFLERLCTLELFDDAQRRLLLAPFMSKKRLRPPWSALQRVVVTTLGRRPVDARWVLETLTAALQHGSDRDRRVAVSALGGHVRRWPALAPLLLEAARDPDDKVRALTFMHLGDLPPSYTDQVLEVLAANTPRSLPGAARYCARRLRQRALLPPRQQP